MTSDFFLRDVVQDDLPIFFEQGLDPEANHMAAFTAKDPSNRAAFDAHWKKILSDATVTVRTIVWDGQVAGHVLSYTEGGRPEVSYWIGKEYWGQGIATRALSTFLAQVKTTRPIYARVARDNVASLRVLEKCGFTIIGEDRGFANARDKEIPELILELTASAGENGTVLPDQIKVSHTDILPPDLDQELTAASIREDFKPTQRLRRGLGDGRQSIFRSGRGLLRGTEIPLRPSASACISIPSMVSGPTPRRCSIATDPTAR